MSGFFRNTWPHFLVWGAMVAYLIAAPGVHDHYFVHVGRPVQVKVTLPAAVDQPKSFVDRLDTYDEQNGIYQLLGWAFLTVDKRIPASGYERQVVLLTKSGNYVFAANTILRIDVQLRYNNLGMNVRNSGFSAFIASSVLKPGIYNIGLLLTQTASGAVYYIDNGRCLNRTPNRLTLEKVDSPVCKTP